MVIDGNTKFVKLKVMEALQEDAYKGIARVDTATMKQIGVRPGDVVILKGGRESVAIIDRAYPADVGEGIIRIDGIIRRNAKTGIGETITVIKTEIKEAKKVVIAPAQKGITVRADPEVFRRGLFGRAMVVGDLVVLGGTQRRHDLSEEFDAGDLGSIFGEVFGNMGMNLGNFGGATQVKFIVASTNPKQPVVITESTEVVLNPNAVDIVEEKVLDVTYEDIGGLDEEIKKIREMVELPLKHPEVFARLGVEPPKGVLLYGPPGTGKTLLAKAVASETEANFILLNGPEIMSKFYGESEKKVRDIFEQAEKNAPSIIFIDEIDAIAPKREESFGEVERRVVSQLLTMMDGLKNRGRIVVIGATNRPNSIDEALRRPGRFDREISISVPDKAGRLSVLKIHTRNMPITKDVKLEELSAVSHGFVGADLSALCKEAAMAALRRILPDLKLKEDEPLSQELLAKLIVTSKDFKDALKNVKPSAMREVLVESPNVKWTDIGGLDTVKQELKEAVEWPIKYPASFKRIGISPPKGILIYGPPGTGKTLLAKAVATESEANFIQIKGPSLLSMWVGKSEEGVRKIFERARQVAPCIIFFDEIDSLAGRRGRDLSSGVTERVLNQLLAEMDGIESLNEIVVIGATNRPDMLDPAILRPGRFDRLVKVLPPNKEERLAIFKVHTKNMPLAKDISLASLSEKTDGFTGADIESICRESGMLALRDDIEAKEVKKKHFDAAFKKFGPSVSVNDVKRYNDIETNYLRSARAALKDNEHSYTG
ncbi:MAG: CDC48 family AAA ATPase [Candidatus Pacearchaeota archaeon]|nr:CDC48 family AAA ATPase [Candidatus Pacearchaeota archaeon]